MYIDLSELSPNQVYYSMIQTLVPRPVAWVLSDNGTRSASGAASYNLAPFSYFTGISSKPPTIMISVGKKPDGSFKDTRVNIEARGQFVVHIAHRELAPSVTESSRTLAHGESELDRLDLDLADFADFRLPRIAGCRVAMATDRRILGDRVTCRRALTPIGESSAIR